MIRILTVTVVILHYQYLNFASGSTGVFCHPSCLDVKQSLFCVIATSCIFQHGIQHTVTACLLRRSPVNRYVLGCRDAPLPADGDIDGALEQMSSFADQSAQTTADEELYSSSLTGQHAPRLSPRGQDRVPTSPQVLSSCFAIKGQLPQCETLS